MHLAVETLDIGRFDDLLLLVVDIGAVSVDVAPHRVALEYVEVGALEASVGHVDQVGVPEQFVLDADAGRVGGEAQADAARALGAFPQVGPHAVFQISWNAGKRAQGVVPALIDHAQIERIDEFPGPFRLIGGAEGHHGQQSQRKK